MSLIERGLVGSQRDRFTDRFSSTSPSTAPIDCSSPFGSHDDFLIEEAFRNHRSGQDWGTPSPGPHGSFLRRARSGSKLVPLDEDNAEDLSTLPSPVVDDIVVPTVNRPARSGTHDTLGTASDDDGPRLEVSRAGGLRRAMSLDQADETARAGSPSSQRQVSLSKTASIVSSSSRGGADAEEGYPTLCEGYMRKQGGPFRRWRNRFFNLTAARLVWRESPSKDVLGCIVPEEVLGVATSKNVISVKTADKMYVLQPPDGELPRWLETLEEFRRGGARNTHDR